MKRKIMLFQNIVRFHSFKKQRGFTIIEVMVSTAIFGVLSIFVVGSYLTISSLQRTTSARQQVASEERFALDTLGREITWAVAIPDCPASGCDKIRFASHPRPDTAIRTIEYRLVGQNVIKSETKSFGVCQTAPDVGDPKDPLDDIAFPPECDQKVFSDAVKITSLKFFVSNNVDNEKQVIVTVAMKGTVTVGGKSQTLSLSSTFTPRFSQSSTLLVNGSMLPVAPSIFSSGIWNGCYNKWYVIWYPVPGASDYVADYCLGSCDPDPTKWPPSSIVANISFNVTSGYYFGLTDEPRRQPPGTVFNMAVRAHQMVGDSYSLYSNVVTAINPPYQSPPVCGSSSSSSSSGSSSSSSGSSSGGGKKGGGGGEK